MIPTYLLVTFVAEHPGVALAVLGLLGSTIAGLVGSYWVMISKRLDKLECTDSHIEGRVQDIEETLVSYKEKVGAGETMLQGLHRSISSISTQLSAMHEDNLLTHAAIVERLARVEVKLPNGQLQEVLDIVKGLARGR